MNNGLINIGKIGNKQLSIGNNQVYWAPSENKFIVIKIILIQENILLKNVHTIMK